MVVLLAIVLAEAGVTSSPAANLQHEDRGFLIGLELGAGYSIFRRDPNFTPSGATLIGGLHVGYRFFSHFAIGAHLFDAFQPDSHQSNFLQTQLNLLCAGPELSFLYDGWTFAVTPELLRIDMRTTTPTAHRFYANTDFEGRGVGVAIAKQWPISGGLRAGLIAQFNYAYLGYGYNPIPYGLTFTYQKYTIAMLVGSVAGVVTF